MELPLHEHLGELRKRVFIVLLFLLVFFVIGFMFSDFFIKQIIDDLIFIENIKVVGLSPVEYILTQVKIGGLLAFVFSLPVIIYQLLVFIRPGLNKKEKEGLTMVLPSFILLFLIGVVFAYFMFLPVAVYFLGNLSKGIIENIWSIGKFVDFVLLSCLMFGLIFQMPLLLIVLNRLGLVKAEWLKKYRAHVYVIIFLVAALITPPDIVTQLIIGLPLVLLYEVSLWFVN